MTWLFHIGVKFCHANLIQRETTLVMRYNLTPIIFPKLWKPTHYKCFLPKIFCMRDFAMTCFFLQSCLSLQLNLQFVTHKETHSTKMGADSLAENNPNASKNVCPSPKVRDFWSSLWVSVVRGVHYTASTSILWRLIWYIMYVI